jgi:hypothetical protein
MHSMQTFIVALLVPSCTLYAAWKLMPSGLRKSLAAMVLRLPHLPGPVETTMRRAAKQASGCGCDGCDNAAKKPEAQADKPQPVIFHRRAR